MSSYCPPREKDLQTPERDEADYKSELENFKREVEAVKFSFAYGGSYGSLSGKQKKEIIRQEILRLLHLKPDPLDGSLKSFTIKEAKEIFVAEYGFIRSILKGEVEQKKLAEQKNGGSTPDVYALPEDYDKWNQKQEFRQDASTSDAAHDAQTESPADASEQMNSNEEANHIALQGVKSEKIKIQQKIISLTDDLKGWERIEDEILALLSRNQS
jgi:hypothetical protein